MGAAVKRFVFGVLVFVLASPAWSTFGPVFEGSGTYGGKKYLSAIGACRSYRGGTDVQMVNSTACCTNEQVSAGTCPNQVVFRTVDPGYLNPNYGHENFSGYMFGSDQWDSFVEYDYSGSCESDPGVHREGNFCVADSCVSPSTFNQSTGQCEAPPCQAGTQFLGHGANTSPKCLNGCAYAIGSESRYTTEGALSRWVSTGTTCSAGNELTPADNSGCPNEVAEDLRPLLCGLAPPCETGKFLFNGECVADTTESGCVIIDGEQICAEADQNCVIVDGKRVCVEAPEPEDLETYKDNGCVWSLAQGAWVCPSETGKKTETSTTTSVTDPVTGQVTKTKVTTTKDNVLPGVQTTTTTTVYDSDGNELSSETVTKTEGGAGQMSALIARAASALGEKEDLDWLRTYEEVRESLSEQWEGLEVVQAVKSFQNLSLTAVEGVCPEFCLPLWGETLCTTAHCEIWAQVSFVIQGVLLALYGMAAIRIVLSA